LNKSDCGFHGFHYIKTADYNLQTQRGDCWLYKVLAVKSVLQIDYPQHNHCHHLLLLQRAAHRLEETAARWLDNERFLQVIWIKPWNINYTWGPASRLSSYHLRKKEGRKQLKEISLFWDSDYTVRCDMLVAHYKLYSHEMQENYVIKLTGKS
jgi:hypothetical protein